MDFVLMKFILEMKLYFVICVYFIAVMESLEAFNQQDQRSLSCVSDTEHYICYSPENDEVFSVKREQMDELLDLSDNPLQPNTDFYDFDLGEDEKDNQPLTTHTAEKREIHRVPTFEGSKQSRMSLIDVLSYMKKKWYPYRTKHTQYRKRPFDSISYRGQFGGFGRR